MALIKRRAVHQKAVRERRQPARNGYEIMVRVASGLETLAVHQPSSKLRRETEVPPHGKRNEGIGAVCHPATVYGRKKHGHSEHKEHCQTHQAPLTKRPGPCPGVESSADINLR